MLKPGFGTVDAPWAWALELSDSLKEHGLAPTQADPRLYVKHVGGQLVLLVSTHVDDLKGCGVDKHVSALIEFLESKYGKLVTHYPPFEHCGVMHSVDDKTGDITMSQDHYILQLRPIADASVSAMKSDAPVGQELISAYMSLLGGVAWLAQTRADILCFVGYLQRHAKAPNASHVLELNKLLKYLKRTKASVRYTKPSGKMVVACISDSAFQTKEPDCLALRGGIIALLETGDDQREPGGALHVLEFFSRKQKRVTRSTFGAELHSLSECSEMGMLIAGCVHEVTHGACPASQLAQLESTGSFGVVIYIFLDAESVFSAVTASELSVPTEANLLYPLKALREHLDAGRIKRVFWIDTRDML
jgi:hypothetical protein